MTKPGIAPLACVSLAAFFAVLKLTKTIDWSWYWIVAPIWLPLIFIILIALVLTGLGFFVEKKEVEKDFRQ